MLLYTEMSIRQRLCVNRGNGSLKFGLVNPFITAFTDTREINYAAYNRMQERTFQ